MSQNAAFKTLVKELQNFSAASFRRRSKDSMKKEAALLRYKKMQLLRAGKKITPELATKLDNEVKQRFAAKIPKPDTTMLAYLDTEELTPSGKRHVQDLTLFLKSQRVYEELLERYNPGISMKQKDKIEKTARRVGLEVPE